MSKDKEYMRIYMANKYARRKKECIELLGGKCVRCGSIKDLQFDHIDPSTKLFSIGGKLAGVAKKRLEEELKKCQLLCLDCHIEKTVTEDRGQVMARGTHGTLSSYKYCKCDICKKAKSESNRQQRLRVCSTTVNALAS